MQEHVTMEVYDNDWIATSNTMACFGFYKEGSNQEELAKFWLNGGGEVSKFYGPLFGKAKKNYITDTEMPKYKDLSYLLKTFISLKKTYRITRSFWKDFNNIFSFVSLVLFGVISIVLSFVAFMTQFQIVVSVLLGITFVFFIFAVIWFLSLKNRYTQGLLHADEYNRHLDDLLREQVNNGKKIMLGEEMQSYFRNILDSKNKTNATSVKKNASLNIDENELIRLKKLFDDGLIDENEYKQKKAQILGL